MIDQKLLAILVCPRCKGELKYQREAAELLCLADNLAFPIVDDIPVMLTDRARRLAPEERSAH